MKCARLNLQARTKPREIKCDRPRRYCQKRMVNPQHEEDPRWADVLESLCYRFHCDIDSIQNYCNDVLDSPRVQNDDIYLSVQTLQFQGDVKDKKRPRTCFKYKALTNERNHRMFIKQTVYDQEHYDEDRSSRLTCYYLDDYVKYLINNDRSRPSTGKSSIFLYSISNKFKEKGTQVDTKQNTDPKMIRKTESKPTREKSKRNVRENTNTEPTLNIDDTKIEFHKSGKRKSLTISRTQSPETVQVIRVDVVCNNSSNSAVIDCEENKKSIVIKEEKIIDKKLENLTFKKTHFANKYLLTNTVKTLDENISGGAKVTLLCKTFKLSNRSKVMLNGKSNVTKDLSKFIRNKMVK